MKKQISLVAAIMVLFTTLFSNSVFAAFTDVSSDNKYYNAITTLSKLNVINGYEDGTFKPDGTITRGEFTKIAVFTLGLGDLQTAPTEFSDVADHWAKYYIKTAYDSGIINGMGDGTFAPDANVTYEQAIKMVVCMLGYGKSAEVSGGYPDGYIAQAAALKLNKDITGASYDQPATRGTIAQLMYNALEVNMMETSLDGTNSTTTDKNLLNDYLNVKKLRGTLVGVEQYVTADCSQTLNLNEMDILGSGNEGEVIINYSDYTTNVTEISKYLGKMITVYYKQKSNNDEPRLVIIDDETINNTDYAINYNDIASFDGSGIRYYPEDSNTSRLLRFNPEAVTVRYNGKVVTSEDKYVLTKTMLNDEGIMTTKESDLLDFNGMLNEWLNPESEFFIYGDIILTDSKSDGTIDDIQINDYQTIVAYKAPTTSDYRITDRLITGNGLILNPDSVEYSYTIVKNGNEIPVTSIASGDIVLYARSLDGELYTCYAGKETVTGAISSIDFSGRKITIDGTSYNMGDYLEKYISTNQEGKVLSAGQSGTFYADKYGTIVYGTVQEEKAKPYGYIINTYDSDDGNGKYITAFIPSVSSSVVRYPLKERLSVNGSTVKAAEAANILNDMASDPINSSSVYYNNNDIYNQEFNNSIYDGSATNVTNAAQVARIEVNSDKEVTSIVTMTSDEAAYNSDGTTNMSTNEDSSKIVRCKDLAHYSYTSSSFRLNNKSQFQINSSTTIIYVPGDRGDMEEYARKTTSNFNSTEQYYVEAYDINSSRVAGLVVLYGASGSSTPVSKTTDFSIVAAPSQIEYDVDSDENRRKIEVYAGTSNAVKSWITADMTEFEDVVPGDVLLFGYDKNRYAQDRVDVMKFADIEAVLDRVDTAEVTDDEGTHEEAYNWKEAPDSDDTVQTEKFNYRFPKENPSGTYWYETWSSSTLGTIPYSRACMYNVYQIQEENNKLLVTQGGFEIIDGEVSNTLYNPDDYEEITISSSTKFIRMEDSRDEFSPYAQDTETNLTYLDLKAAQNYGADCSKILVCSLRGSARLIVIYE